MLDRIIGLLKAIHTTKGSRLIAGVIVAIAALWFKHDIDGGHLADLIDTLSMLGLAVLGVDAQSND